MDISFRTKKLQTWANDYRACVRDLGKDRAQLYIKRLNSMYAADSLEDVRHLPGNFHELSGDRKGQWACNLDQPYRLIFEPVNDPIPVDANGKFVWIEIREIEILEITNYHGK